MWVNQGWVDEIIPQLYRYDIERYKKELDKVLNRQIAPCYQDRFYPGILLQVDSYNPSQAFLQQMIQANRQHGISGEVFFFYEGIRKFPGIFQETYQAEPAD